MHRYPHSLDGDATFAPDDKAGRATGHGFDYRHYQGRYWSRPDLGPSRTVEEVAQDAHVWHRTDAMNANLSSVLVIALALCLIVAEHLPVLADGTVTHRHHNSSGDTMREAPADMAVRLKVVPDAEGGYNLNILPQGFRFSPENTGRASDASEGHAHLYLNGKKTARIYGPWFHVPPEWLRPGTNEIRVTLNDNRHTDWSRDGAGIAAVVMVDRGKLEAIEIAYSPGERARTYNVAQGTRVRLILTTHEPVDLHLHGYDIVAKAIPRAPAIITFHAEHAGRFALVVHRQGDLLGRDETAVAHIEVEPR